MAKQTPASVRGDIWSPRIRWLIGLSVAAMVAVNAAGIWSIASARRRVVEQTAKIFHLETAARAHAIESALSSARAELGFLTGSEAFFTLEAALSSPDPREARWRRLGAEGALLLFLRGHLEVQRLAVRSRAGSSLVEVGRRGGVPVIWRSSSAGTPAGASVRVTALFASEAGSGRQADLVTIDAELDLPALMSHGRGLFEASRACVLRDAQGAILAAEQPGRDEPQRPAGDREGTRSEDRLAAEAPVSAEGWSAPAPWRLECAQRGGSTAALIDPLAARYRITMGLNLAVMALTLLLGSFTIQQVRRRERLEAGVREEARVRELERRLFHSERLSTVGRLAAGMAHEINNPLEGMSNYVSLAGQALEHGDASAARRHLDRVREGIERAAGVVRLVLAHADPARAPETPLDLSPVLAQAVEFVKSQHEFAGIRFDLEIAGGDLGMRGSPVMLGQVFLNLLLNACEAQPGGGQVGVKGWRDKEAVRVEIADRGPGVPAAEVARIFEPFYSTKQSTGLGLSICHSIVRQHGGELTVKDRPGGGALFELRFPSCEAGID